MAAGASATADAAAAVLAAGGSAVDAVVAAGFAACVAEPGLTSPAGGGFLQVREPDGTTTLLDFFVDAPGLGRDAALPRPQLRAVLVRFAGTEQPFAVGAASVAVPGCLAGWTTAHARWGRLALPEVLAPARGLAIDGVDLEPAAAQVLGLIADVLTDTPEGAALYAPAGRPLAAGEHFANPDLAPFLDLVASGARGWDDPRLAPALLEVAGGGLGLLTEADLAAGGARTRTPLTVRLPQGTLTTNPPPSFGGSVVAAALARLGSLSDPASWTWAQLVAALVAATREVKDAGVRKGTTHVSVVDAEGLVASMTTSNGSCSGVLVPGLGVELNNMLGESDLHPLGAEHAEPGTRIGSMMAPSLWAADDGAVTALGSGGSERIRSALLEVVAAHALSGHPLEVAVGAPRVHPDDDGVLQVEPGFDAAGLSALREAGPVNLWDAADLYFGGVHAVRRDRDGAVTAVADARRGGAVRVVSPRRAS